MKKILSIITAVMLLALVAFPAMAISGVEADPGLPVVGELTEDPFGATLTLVDNEPTVEYDVWGFPYNVWEPIAADTQFAVGDIVTFTFEYAVPAEVPGYTTEMLNSIDYVLTANGINDLELVEAVGCVQNYTCDYSIGICYPGEGYKNCNVEGNACVMNGYLNSDVTVVLRGVVGGAVTFQVTETIGQHQLPAEFSLGTLSKTSVRGMDAYMIHHVDVMNVIKKDVYFVVNDDATFNSLIVGVESHYNTGLFEVNEAMNAITRLDDDFNSTGEVVTSGELFDIIIDAAQTRMELFNFSFGQGGIITEGVFLMQSEPVSMSWEQEMNVDVPEVTPEPTEEPEPTDEPAPPITGAAGWTVGAIIAVVVGILVAGIAVFMSIRKARSN